MVLIAATYLKAGCSLSDCYKELILTSYADLYSAFCLCIIDY